MDAQQLDLCLSCGSHVADGSAYCSSRCNTQDNSKHSSRRSAVPSLMIASSSSTSSYAPSSSRSSSSSQHLPSYHSTYHSPLYCPDPKVASISEWAKGVWGSPPRVEACITDLPKTSTKTPFTHRRSYTPPRFQLTPQALALPAMSIAPSSNVTTPCSSVKSVPPHEQIDPWISSPRGRALIRL